MTSHLEVYYSSAEPQQYYFSKCFPGRCVSGCGDCEMFSRMGSAAEQRIQGGVNSSGELHCQLTTLLHGLSMNVQHRGVPGVCVRSAAGLEQGP